MQKTSKLFLGILMFFIAISCPVQANVPSTAEIIAMTGEYDGKPYTDINGDVPYFTSQEVTSIPFEDYGELDQLGRCTGAIACVGPETMPTEGREDISDIKPTGWINRKYAGIDQDWLYNRCHLIGFQLTGENANEKNLITGTRYMNIEGMLQFEDSVAQYVRGTGNHVMYRVTPVFEGDNLLADGVLMEAQSVEDPSIQYCVFCYNVQPGVTINYATGESSGPEYNSIAEMDKSMYVVNTNTGRYHLPGCPSAAEIMVKNRMERTSTPEELQKMGYMPCRRCNPG